MKHRIFIPRGFTLIELLTVIAIIGILAAIIIPTVGKVRDTAKDANCKSNLRQIGMATQLYLQENRQLYPLRNRNDITTSVPNGYSWHQVLNQYLTGQDTTGIWARLKVFNCPTSAVGIQNTGVQVPVSYSANRNIMLDPTVADPNGFSTGTPPARIHSSRVLRPSETVVFADALQSTGGDAQGNLSQMGGAAATGQADEVFSVDTLQSAQATDATQGTAGGYMRFRHGGGSKANAVFADGHVAPLAIDGVKNRNLTIRNY